MRCVLIGKNLAKILKEKCKKYPDNITIDNCSFESWIPQQIKKASLIFSATAFHWIDEKIKYKKCHDLLIDNGYLALLWNIPPKESDDPMIQKAFDLLWKYAPSKNNSNESEKSIKDKRIEDIVESSYFGFVDFYECKWKLVHTYEKFLLGFQTHSSFLLMEEKKKKEIVTKFKKIFNPLDKKIESEFTTTVYIARKNKKR